MLVIIPLDDDGFDEEKGLEFILNPNLDKDENRVYYVALSRAKKNLFINVPKLSKGNKQQLETIGFNVIDLEKQ